MIQLNVVLSPYQSLFTLLHKYVNKTGIHMDNLVQGRSLMIRLS